MSRASPGQGCDCRLKGGRGCLLVGSSIAGGEPAGAWLWADAEDTAATARPLPTAPTTCRRDSEPSSWVLMPDSYEQEAGVTEQRTYGCMTPPTQYRKAYSAFLESISFTSCRTLSHEHSY